MNWIYQKHLTSIENTREWTNRMKESIGHLRSKGNLTRETFSFVFLSMHFLVKIEIRFRKKVNWMQNLQPSLTSSLCCSSRIWLSLRRISLPTVSNLCLVSRRSLQQQQNSFNIIVRYDKSNGRSWLWCLLLCSYQIRSCSAKFFGYGSLSLYFTLQWALQIQQFHFIKFLRATITPILIGIMVMQWAWI